MRKLLPWTMAAVVALGIACLCPAQIAKPVATVSFSGYEELMKDIELIGRLGNFPDLAKILEAQLQQHVPSELSAALDKKKPWGVVAALGPDTPQPVGVAFVPLKDLKPLLEVIRSQGIEPKDAGDGTFQIQAGPQAILLKQKGAWTLLGTSKEALAEVPDDPTQLLGGLHEKYNLAARLTVKNIPPATRDAALLPVMMGFQMATMRQLPGETTEQYEFRSKMSQQALQQITDTIKDLDSILLGLAVDEKTSSARLDLAVTFVPDSKYAKRLAQSGDLKTDFAGLMDPDAALLATFSGQMDEQQITQARANLAALKANFLAEIDKQGLPPDEAKQARQLAGDLMDALEKTIQTGKLDGGLRLKLGPKNLQLVAALRIAEGAKLEQTVKELIQRIAKDVPPVAQAVRFDAETHQQVRFHLVSVPTDQLDPHARQVFQQVVGDKLELILGIGQDSLYVSAGRDAAKALKDLIDRSQSASDKSAPPMQLSVSLTPIAQFVAAVGDQQAKQGAEMLLSVLSAATGKDHIKLTVTLIPNGEQARVELEEGILRLIGSIPAMIPSSR